MSDRPKCELCGELMPDGEEMFKFHGYSGPCPKPPLPQALTSSTQDRIAELERERDELSQMASDANLWAEKQGQLAMRALAENRALDEAVAWIRVVGEECDARGDRTVILAKLRADRAENRALREALRSRCIWRGDWRAQCYLCDAEQWRLGDPERHATGCLAAPQKPAQEGERG